MADLEALGLFRLLSPARFGGHELGFETLVGVAVELGQGCASAAWVGSLFASHGWLLAALFPDQAQQDVWDEEPDAMIAASIHPQGEAVRAPGGVRLSGRWSFASGIDHADWVVVAAPVPGGADGAAPGMTLFLLPKRNFEILDTWYAAGLRGTGSNTVVVNDVFVPEHRAASVPLLIEGQGEGASVNEAPLYRLPLVAGHIFALVGPAIGAALGAMNDWTAWTRARRHVLTGQPVVGLAPLHVRLGESAAELDAAQLLVRRDLAEVLPIVASGRELTRMQRARSRRDAAYAVLLCSRAISRIFQASGGSVLYDDYAIQRAWRDIHAVASHVMLSWDAASAHFGRMELGLPPADLFV